MEFFVTANTKIKKVYSTPSKSFAQRAILAATLSKKTSTISNIGTSDDVKNMLKIAAQLGAKVEIFEDTVKIKGLQKKVKSKLNCGESGLGLRITTIIGTALSENYTVNGKGSLLKRSMIDFNSIMKELQLEIISNDNFLPISISGKVKGGHLTIDGSNSSQYLTGLLLLLPTLAENSTINVKHLKSKPYIDITIELLNKFGIKIRHKNYEKFVIKGNQKYNLTDELIIENDYSEAANWMVYGAINKGIKIEGLNKNSVQADIMMLKALKAAEIKHKWKKGDLSIKKSKPSPFKFDATDCPDLFPPLVILAASAKGLSRISGVNRLINKESNRGIVLAKQFGKLGLEIEIVNDVMLIYGTGTLESGSIRSNNDHRIAMAGAIAASLTKKGIKIEKAEAVKKSAPHFWQNFQ